MQAWVLMGNHYHLSIETPEANLVAGEHNASRQVKAVTDPAGRKTTFIRCLCGALQALIDAKNQQTSFLYDDQVRLTDKLYADGRGRHYEYGPVGGRLSSITDAKSQRANFTWYADHSLATVSYTNAQGAPLDPLTPTVTLAPKIPDAYPRIGTITDGTGTTTFAYVPAGQNGAGAVGSETWVGPAAPMRKPMRKRSSGERAMSNCR